MCRRAKRPNWRDDCDDHGHEVRKRLKAAMSLVSMAGLSGRLKSGGWQSTSGALADMWKATDLPDKSVREFCCETVCMEILLEAPMKAMSGKLGVLCQSRLFCNRMLFEKRQEPDLTNDELKEWAVQLFSACIHAAFDRGHSPERAAHACQRLVINMLCWRIGIVHQITIVMQRMRIDPLAIFPTSVGKDAVVHSTEPGEAHRCQPAEEALLHAPTFLYYLLNKACGDPWPVDPRATRLRSGTLHALQRGSWDGYLIALANCYGGASNRNDDALR